MSQTYYTKPAENFNEAQPLGNGTIGAMLFGKTENEHIGLNHDTLWTGIPWHETREGNYDAYMKARTEVLTEKYADAHTTITEGFASRNNSDRYQPFGDLVITFPKGGEVENYARVLSLDDAVARVTYTQDGVSYTREMFCSYPDKLLAIRLTVDKPGTLSFKAHLKSPHKNSIIAGDGRVILDGECPLSYTPDESPIYSSDPKQRGIRFAGELRVKTDGTVINPDLTHSSSAVCVENATEAVLFVSITSSYIDPYHRPDGEYRKPLTEILDKAEALGWDKLIARHLEDYHALYNQISLDLGSSGREELPTDERLARFEEDKNDCSLYTLLFDFGRYLTIAGSREGSLAMNLQGIWNEKLKPDWRCNYTLNINTEMNYWPTLMCGLESCYEPLLKFIENRVESGRKTAREMYHAPGFVMHHNSDIWAMTTPAMCGNACWGFWNGAAGWLCYHLYEYYAYTGNVDYLRKTAYPIMLEAAEFYLSQLIKQDDGRLSVCPSASPENTFITAEGQRSAVSKWTAMSDSIACSLFRNCLEAAKILGDNSTLLAQLDSALAEMKPYEIGTDGRIMEWNEEFVEREVTHRHLSHLWALHPARMITVRDKEYATACRKSLETRGDRGTGWSLGWKINMWARLGDGNRAKQLLDMQLHLVSSDVETNRTTGGTYPNLFDAHPPFQIDGNFSMTSGILEMLASQIPTENGEELVLLPALPDGWKNGSLRGMRLRGGQILDMCWKDGKIAEHSLKKA